MSLVFAGIASHAPGITGRAHLADPAVVREFHGAFRAMGERLAAARPDALISDGEVISEVMAAFAARGSRPPPPTFGPTREELLALLEP